MPDSRTGLGRVRQDVSGSQVHVRVWAVRLDGQGLFPGGYGRGRVFCRTKHRNVSSGRGNVDRIE